MRSPEDFIETYLRRRVREGLPLAKLDIGQVPSPAGVMSDSGFYAAIVNVKTGAVIYRSHAMTINGAMSRLVDTPLPVDSRHRLPAEIELVMRPVRSVEVAQDPDAGADQAGETIVLEDGSQVKCEVRKHVPRKPKLPKRHTVSYRANWPGEEVDVYTSVVSAVSTVQAAALVKATVQGSGGTFHAIEIVELYVEPAEEEVA